MTALTGRLNNSIQACMYNKGERTMYKFFENINTLDELKKA